MTSSLLLSTCKEFGKLGLLIDDAPGAPAAIARQLYGADALPSWWLVARSMACGAKLIEELLILRRDGQLPPLSGLITFVDRFLLPDCKAHKPDAWDEGSSTEEKKQFREQLLKLYDVTCYEERHWFGRLISSYTHKAIAPQTGAPAPLTDRKGRSLNWHRRQIEVPYQVASRVLEIERERTFGCWSLLSYGPSPGAKVAWGGHDPADHPGWHARAWQPALWELSRWLQDKQKVTTLVAEYRSSVANTGTSAGMPPWSWLVEQAARWLHGKAEPRMGHALGLAHCDGCSGSVGSDQGSLKFGQVLEEVRTDPPSRDPKFLNQPIDSLSLSQHQHKCDDSDWKGLLEQMGRVVETFDQGLPFHVWLQASLPWDHLETVNFDHFLERAEGAAVAAGLRTTRRTVTRRRQGPISAKSIAVKKVKKRNIKPSDGLAWIGDGDYFSKLIGEPSPQRVVMITGNPQQSDRARRTEHPWTTMEGVKSFHADSEPHRKPWLDHHRHPLAPAPSMPLLLPFNLRPLDFAFDLKLLCGLEDAKRPPLVHPPWLPDPSLASPSPDVPPVRVQIVADEGEVPERIARDLRLWLGFAERAGLIQLVEEEDEIEMNIECDGEDVWAVCGDSAFDLTELNRKGEQLDPHQEGLEEAMRHLIHEARRRRPASLLLDARARRDFMKDVAIPDPGAVISRLGGQGTCEELARDLLSVASADRLRPLAEEVPALAGLIAWEDGLDDMLKEIFPQEPPLAPLSR